MFAHELAKSGSGPVDANNPTPDAEDGAYLDRMSGEGQRHPTVNAASVEAARQEWSTKVRNSPDVRVNLITFDPEGEEDDATGLVQLAHALCVKEWGPDDERCDVRTRADPTVVTGSTNTIHGQDLSQRYLMRTDRK